MNFNIGSLTFIFRNPSQDYLLLSILILVTIIAYFVMRSLRGRRAAYFGNLKTLRRTHGYKVFHISSIVLIIKLIVIILLYLVATNSIMIRDYKPVSNMDYVLLLDDSSSMAKSDYPPDRLSSAKLIAKEWINILPNSTRVGLVAFSTGVDKLLPLATDKKTLLRSVDDIEIDYTKSGTNLDFAISQALDLFSDSDSENKTILLMTDGTELLSNKTISRVRKNNIKMIIFGIGDDSKESSFEDVPDGFRDSFNNLDLNFTALQTIANATKGVAYKVNNKAELQDSFNQAVLHEVQVSLDSGFYVTLLIAFISILELLVYARLGAL